MIHLSIVIPLYNESSLIEELVRRVEENAKKVTDNYEILLIDDGSIDLTWEKINLEIKKRVKIKGIKFSRNFGHHYAITAGLHHAKGEWVVVMDGDLQDRPEVIPDLYKHALEGFEVVFVSRQNRPEKITYRIAQKLFYLVLRKLSGINFNSEQANFSIIHRKVVEAFNIFPENARFYGSTVLWLGFKRSQIYADHGKRFSGSSSYSLAKRLRLASDIIISFSENPIKIAIRFGILMSLISLMITMMIIYQSIFSGYTVSGWASIMSAIFFSTGVILIVIGIVGIYIGQIFKQVKNRPLYVISEKNNLD
jgi:glycosyltransferase involved in cell wall biosynthesis